MSSPAVMPEPITPNTIRRALPACALTWRPADRTPTCSALAAVAADVLTSRPYSTRGHHRAPNRRPDTRPRCPGRPPDYRRPGAVPPRADVPLDRHYSSRHCQTLPVPGNPRQNVQIPARDRHPARPGHLNRPVARQRRIPPRLYVSAHQNQTPPPERSHSPRTLSICCPQPEPSNPLTASRPHPSGSDPQPDPPSRPPSPSPHPSPRRPPVLPSRRPPEPSHRPSDVDSSPKLISARRRADQYLPARRHRRAQKRLPGHAVRHHPNDVTTRLDGQIAPPL